MSQGRNIPNYLVQSILCTICCCLPGGIVAIVYAAQVNGKVASGDFAGAEASSRSAKNWCLISLIAGLLINLAVGGFYAVVTYKVATDPNFQKQFQEQMEKAQKEQESRNK